MGAAGAYLGDAISTDYAIGKSFQGLVKIDHFSPLPADVFAFALARDNPRLQRTVNEALARISDSERLNILRRWSSGNTSLLMKNPVGALTPEERDWIAHNPKVRVLVNPSLAPLTFNDAQQHPTGITIDLLKRIRLQTGLRFEIVEVDSIRTWSTKWPRAGADNWRPGLRRRTCDAPSLYSPLCGQPRVLITRSEAPGSAHR